MSEVDRLSNSGLHPALPIADRQRGQGSGARSGPDRRVPTAREPAGHPDETGDSTSPDGPRSHIDEYA
jgi:hypothetical protein